MLRHFMRDRRKCRSMRMCRIILRTLRIPMPQIPRRSPRKSPPQIPHRLLPRSSLQAEKMFWEAPGWWETEPMCIFPQEICRYWAEMQAGQIPEQERDRVLPDRPARYLLPAVCGPIILLAAGSRNIPSWMGRLWPTRHIMAAGGWEAWRFRRGSGKSDSFPLPEVP